MRKGRELVGLPVFSWREDALLGHVVDLALDTGVTRLAGFYLQRKGLSRRHPYLDIADVLKIYDDGVIARREDVVKARGPGGEQALRYSHFLAQADYSGGEGEVIADLCVDDRHQVAGYEISRGFWQDLSCGRSYAPRSENDWK